MNDKAVWNIALAIVAVAVVVTAVIWLLQQWWFYASIAGAVLLIGAYFWVKAKG